MSDIFINGQSILELVEECDELKQKIESAQNIINQGCYWELPDEVLKKISEALK